MARPRKMLPSRSSLVPAIMRHAAASELDVEALAWRFGLPHDVALREEVTTAAEIADELLHAIARTGGREGDVSLRVATELTGRQHTLVGLAVRATADIRSALAKLAHCVPLLQEGLRAALEEDVAEARWVLRTPGRPRGVGRYVHELVLAQALHGVRAGAESVNATRVWFAHARPPELGPLAEFFGTGALSFGCEDSGFAMGRASLDVGMRGAHAPTAEALAPVIDAELGARPRGSSLAERVGAHVASSLPGGTDVADVARAMHMSPRTLQRRLEQEQTRFSDVLDRARLTAARRLLADSGATLTDVAFRLGFADLATFSRAFKRWTGSPPGQWRRS